MLLLAIRLQNRFIIISFIDPGIEREKDTVKHIERSLTEEEYMKQVEFNIFHKRKGKNGKKIK